MDHLFTKDALSMIDGAVDTYRQSKLHYDENHGFAELDRISQQQFSRRSLSPTSDLEQQHQHK
jgi:hypothetical protein